MKRLNFLLIGVLISSAACNSRNPKNTIDLYFTNQQEIKSVKLPNKLKEISGLACSNDGRIFAHNDEKGIVYQIDYRTGNIIKNFRLGKKSLSEDFEGLTIVSDIFYMVASNGDIYEFKEGENESSVTYEKYKTFLSAENDVEGICYDPERNTLLLACKGSPGKKYKGNRAIYEFSLSEKKLHKKPRFLLSIDEIMEGYNSNFTSKLSEFFLLTDNTFAPSDMALHPRTDNFYILASKGNMIIELSKEGKILGKAKLDAKRHHQPEGITFTLDNEMLISDEGVTQKARITCYPAQY